MTTFLKPSRASPRIFMYKELLSDSEIKYLLSLAKSDGDDTLSNTSKKSLQKVKMGAKTADAALRQSREQNRSILYPEYDSFVYSIPDNVVQGKTGGEEGEDADINFSDIVIGNIVHRVSTWSHIPFDNLENFSIDVFKTDTTYQVEMK